MCVYVHKTKKQKHQGDDNTARANSQRKKLLNLLNQIPTHFICDTGYTKGL